MADGGLEVVEEREGTGESSSRFSTGSADVKGVALSTDGTLMVTAGVDGICVVWDVLEGEEVGRLVHEQRINAVCFAPRSNSEIATAGEDGMVRIWVRTSEGWGEKVTFEGHSRYVYALAWKGDLLASGGHDESVILWEVESGERATTLDRLRGEVLCVCFAKDKDVMAISAGKAVTLWDTKRWSILRVFDGHDGEVWSVSLTPHGDLLASASEDETVRVWDCANGEELKVLRGSDEAKVVAWSPDGAVLAGGWGDGVVVWKAWDRSFDTLCEVPSERGLDGFQTIAFKPQTTLSHHLYISFLDHMIHKLRIAADPMPSPPTPPTSSTSSTTPTTPAPQPPTTPSSHTSPTSPPSPTDRLREEVGELERIVEEERARMEKEGGGGGGGEGKSEKELEIEAELKKLQEALVLVEEDEAFEEELKREQEQVWERVGELEGHEALVTCMSASPDGFWWVSGDMDGVVMVWDAEEGRCVKRIGVGCEVFDVAWKKTMEGGSSVFVATSEGWIGEWDGETWKEKKRLCGHRGAVSSIDVGVEILVSGSFDRSVCVWDVESGELVKTLRGHGGNVNCVRLSPLKRHIASASSDATVHIWDAVTFELLHSITTHSAPVTALAFSPSGKLLASAADDLILRTTSVRSGNVVRTTREVGPSVRCIEWCKGVEASRSSTASSRHVWPPTILTVASHVTLRNAADFHPIGILPLPTDAKPMVAKFISPTKILLSTTDYKIYVWAS